MSAAPASAGSGGHTGSGAPTAPGGTSGGTAAGTAGGTAGVGQAGFVARHGLHTDEQLAAAERVAALVGEQDLRSIRIVVADQHGVPRTKWLTGRAFVSALRNGADFSGAIYSLDSANAVFTPAFAEGGGFGIPEFTGFPDVVVVPDPLTFRILPWADRTAWVLCDVYFSNGAPVPLDPRRKLADLLGQARGLGYEYVSGLEVEFYVVRPERSVIELTETGSPAKAPAVTAIEPGYQFLSEYRQAAIEPVMTAIRDALLDVGLPLRTIENEWGPGQVEISLEPMTGLGTADAMVLFRAAIKDVCAARGLLATFMCWPSLPNFFPSGWHLHESLLDAGGGSAFMSPTDVHSPVCGSYAAGILTHARAMTLLASPTVNGLRRFRPYSFAPDRICWGLENRGAMLRLQGAAADAGTHLENRLGEPAANPYLFAAGSLAAGLDGIRNKSKPPPLLESDPYAAEAPMLPTDLESAVVAFESSEFYRGVLGEGFQRYLAMMKRAELARFTAAGAHEGEGVTDWEMDEYFQFY